MRKLLGIGLVLALLATFIVPVAVLAQDECCEYTPPECGPLPAKNTKTLAGAAVWSLLSIQDIMGRAVCATTGQLACNLGGWSDQLGVVAVDISGVGLKGVADLLEYVMEAFVGMPELGKAIGDMLRGIADAIAGTQE
ncbi:MAG: hypothetical protein ACUVTR_02785 [Dehalococcoidia bacterium]